MAVTVTSINISSAYTGTITQGASASLTTTGISSSFSMAGGSFNGSAAGLFMGGSFSSTGGTLNLSGATLTMEDNTIAAFTCSGNFNSLTGVSSVSFNKGSGAARITVSTGCTLSAALTNVAHYLTIQSGATLNATSGLYGDDLTGAVYLNVQGTMNVPYDFSIKSAGVTIGASGALNLGGHSLTIGGGAQQTIACTGNLNTLTGASAIAVNKTGFGLTLSTGCSMTASLISTGDIAHTLSVQSGATLTGTGMSATVQTLLDVQGGLNLPFDFVLRNTLTLGASGVLNLNGHALTIQSPFMAGTTHIACSGNLNALINASSIDLNSPNDGFTLYTGCSMTATITSTGDATHAFTIQPGATFTAAGYTGNVTNPLVIQGTFVAPPTLTLASNFINTGTFNGNNGTVVLTDANHTFTGSATFSNLSKTAGSLSPTLTFEAGSTQTVTGTLTLTGISAAVPLILKSTNVGTQWKIDARGTRTLRYLSVRDSNNINGEPMYAGSGSTDATGNTNWLFVDPPAYTISGTVRQTGSPISGVTVSLNGGASVNTDINGNFTFSNLAPANYTVTPSLAGHSFCPTARTFQPLSSNQTVTFDEDLPTREYVRLGGRVVAIENVCVGP